MNFAKIEGAIFQEILRHVYCMDLSDFQDAFGVPSGTYQHEKFHDHYKGDVGKWLTYLDGSNIRLFLAHCDRHLKKVQDARS